MQDQQKRDQKPRKKHLFAWAGGGAILVIGLVILLLVIGAKPTTVTLMFGYTPNAGFAPFFVAEANGYFDAEGLNVAFQYGQTEAEMIQQLAAGQAQFGYAGDNAAIIARASDVPVVAVQSILQENLFGLYFRPDAGFSKLADLVGHVVASSGPSATPTTLLQIGLAKEGARFSDVKVLYVGGDVVSTFLTGGAEAYASYLPLKVLGQTLAKSTLSEIPFSNYSTIGRTYVFVTEQYIKSHRGLVAKFTRAIRRAIEDSIGDPAKAIDAMLTMVPEAAAQKQSLTAMWTALADRGFPKPLVLRAPSGDNWTQKVADMVSVGALAKPIDVTKVWTDSFAGL